LQHQTYNALSIALASMMSTSRTSVQKRRAHLWLGHVHAADHYEWMFSLAAMVRFAMTGLQQHMYQALSFALASMMSTTSFLRFAP
jgi:hypothetical protein